MRLPTFDRCAFVLVMAQHNNGGNLVFAYVAQNARAYSLSQQQEPKIVQFRYATIRLCPGGAHTQKRLGHPFKTHI